MPINVMGLDHPDTTPDTIHGKVVFHRTGPWCPKGRGDRWVIVSLIHDTVQPSVAPSQGRR